MSVTRIIITKLQGYYNYCPCVKVSRLVACDNKRQFAVLIN